MDASNSLLTLVDRVCIVDAPWSRANLEGFAASANDL
jgi:hypothetical protein